MGKDYYAILNLNRDASAAVVKKRAVFDQYGEEGLKAGVIGPSGRLLGGWQFSSDPQNVFSKFFGKTSPFGDSVLLQDDDVSPWRFDNPGSDRTVPPIQLPLNISLEEAFTGCFKKVTFTRKNSIHLSSDTHNPSVVKNSIHLSSDTHNPSVVKNSIHLSSDTHNPSVVKNSIHLSSDTHNPSVVKNSVHLSSDTHNPSVVKNSIHVSSDTHNPSLVKNSIHISSDTHNPSVVKNSIHLSSDTHNPSVVKNSVHLSSDTHNPSVVKNSIHVSSDTHNPSVVKNSIHVSSDTHNPSVVKNSVLSLALPAVSRGSDSCIFTQKGEGMPVAGRPGERGDLIIKTAVEYPAKLSGKARSTIRKALAEPVRAK
uniref:Chaperone DnaJ C-terminal domain-containing protein n=1 Tax=Chromera velia CCMP2878 TaxID=1169474 RepID=A0A0G4G1J0_9ALVE|eukprot:Cvel_19811.t1-p1 / transcript=Cvel_19811.t1 / gene=Cvel_19811 / organism=Chromera_velia_CCMP2878 / gene_product=DnaJ protein homolog 1, putative / transcript_product=DnaJ protein homolog 1, putative / location=Cvel_scaffold1734:5768-12830(+) / protein_length=367 / sequence_SO=supercontig / SO=protein_coding / is_pseudo=false